jgi:2-desacetyl-2-hydroxyethyl bacteriochlorophyllide A dehydrogenase
VRAAVLDYEPGFEVVEHDDPTPGPGELVLRVRACGICGSDLHIYEGMPPGTVLGHEFCGEVLAVGTDVEGWQEGQLVASMPLRACGRCRWCLTGEVAHCERVDYLGVGGRPGGFAELVRVDPATTFALPSAVGELAALVEPLAVGLHTVAAARLQPGDRAFVIGAGPVGTAVAMWARRLGAAEVVVSDPVAHRREGTATFGATGVHDPTADPPARGFDVVFECVGLPGIIQAALDAVAVHGRVIVAGVCMQPDRIVPLTAIMKEAEVRFAVYYRREEFALAASLLATGEIDPAPFVSGRVGLDGVDEAFTRLRSTTTERKIVVLPGT